MEESRNIYIDFVKNIYQARKDIKEIEKTVKCSCPDFITKMGECSCERAVLIQKKLDRIEDVMKSIDKFMESKGN